MKARLCGAYQSCIYMLQAGHSPSLLWQSVPLTLLRKKVQTNFFDLLPVQLRHHQF